MVIGLTGPIQETKATKAIAEGSAAAFVARIFNPQLGGSLLVPFGVFLLETLDAPSSVNQLLLAGEERVAV